MGARPSSFRKGGGFLNGVDAVITGYQFTDEFNGEPFRPGKDPKTKKERFHALYYVLSARVDGADEDVTTTLFVGGADDWEVSEDGYVISPTEDGRQLGGGTSFAKLLNSLVQPLDGNPGFPEDRLPDEEFDFRPIIGTRVRFVQRKDEEATKKLGKRKGKDGKEYDRQDLLVETVYELPTVESKSNGKAAKPTGKGKGKGVVAALEAPEASLEDLAKETLLEILADAKDGKIVKNKLSMEVLKRLMKHPNREDVRTLVFSDDFLRQQDGWTFDRAKGIVAVE